MRRFLGILLAIVALTAPLAADSVVSGAGQATVTAQDTQVHILALGDSLTQGYGLPVEDGLVPQLSAWLTSRGHNVSIVNGGVSGDTTVGGLARVEWSLTPDIDAMIVLLGANDMLRGMDPALTRKNLHGILAVGAAHDLQMLVIGLPATRNYGPEYKAEFDAIHPELSKEFNSLYVPNYFAALLDGTDDPLAARNQMQPDGIHPSAKGVASIVEAIGPNVEELIARIAPDPVTQ